MSNYKNLVLPKGKVIFGKYLLTEIGEVYSLMFINGRGKHKRIKKLKPHIGRGGYYAICFCSKNVKTTKNIHVLMLEAFVGPRPSGHYCCHKDGNKLNNNISNLYWGTPRQNMLDRNRHGRAPIGSKNKSSKLKEKQVKQIITSYKMGVKQKTLAQRYGVCRDTIMKITNGSYWKHVHAELSSNKESGE